MRAIEKPLSASSIGKIVAAALEAREEEEGELRSQRVKAAKAKCPGV